MASSYAGNYLTDKNAISIYCDLIGATSAKVKVEGNTLTLTIDGSPETVDFATEDTLDKVVIKVNSLTGWEATLLGVPSTASRDNITDQAEVDALGSDNVVTLKTLFDDVINWPTGWIAVQKKEYVDDIEEEVERVTRDYFHARAFDEKFNGNGQDQIFLGFFPDILSVTKVYVHGIEIDSNIWTFDKRSVFLDTETALGSLADWRALRAELQTEVLFPKGMKNIRILGTKGWSSCPREIRRACAMMIMDRFDETLYDHWREGAVSIGGDFSFNNPKRVYTGILIVDRIHN